MDLYYWWPVVEAIRTFLTSPEGMILSISHHPDYENPSSLTRGGVRLAHPLHYQVDPASKADQATGNQKRQPEDLNGRT